MPQPASIAGDARVRRTRDALREAMTELAAELPLDAITVRAITTRAGVGYATFFRHYVDKEALLADLADTLTREFFSRVAPLLINKERRAAARSLCDFVVEHLAIHRALIAGGSGETVRAGMLRQTMETIVAMRGGPAQDPTDDLLLSHLVSSILNLLAWWLRHFEAVDIETMAEMVDRLVLTPVGAVRRQPAATASAA